MDDSLINSLKLTTYPEVKESLMKCKDLIEAWDTLENFEKELNKELDCLRSCDEEKKLLKALHEYNEIKDMTQAVIGTLANLQGITSAMVHEQFNVVND